MNHNKRSKLDLTNLLKDVGEQYSRLSKLENECVVKYTKYLETESVTHAKVSELTKTTLEDEFHRLVHAPVQIDIPKPDSDVFMKTLEEFKSTTREMKRREDELLTEIAKKQKELDAVLESSRKRTTQIDEARSILRERN